MNNNIKTACILCGHHAINCFEYINSVSIQISVKQPLMTPGGRFDIRGMAPNTTFRIKI